MDDWLEIEFELAELHGLAHVGFHLQPLVGDLGHFRREAGIGALALVLGFVHGGIGMLEQGATVIGVLWEGGDTNAGGNEHFLAAQHERCREVLRMRSATWQAASGPLRPGRTTRNSSPPRRATVLVPRRQLETRLEASISRVSPASWPRVSLMCLKLSRSRNITPTWVSSRRAWAMASFRRSSASMRFGNPVSTS